MQVRVPGVRVNAVQSHSRWLNSSRWQNAVAFTAVIRDIKNHMTSAVTYSTDLFVLIKKFFKMDTVLVMTMTVEAKEKGPAS